MPFNLICPTGATGKQPKKALESPVNRPHARVRFGPAGEVIERRSWNWRGKARCIGVVATERDAKPTTGSSQTSDLTNDGSAMRVPAPSARAAIRAIEAVHMICNWRVLAITRKTCTGKTGSSGELLGFGKAGTRG
jgi:hypothetical protein